MFTLPLPSATLKVTAPGRVNLLGEHVDYNDGVVLPAAIDRTVKLAIEPGQGNEVHLVALDLNQEVTFSLLDLEKKVDVTNSPLPAWALYPAGVAWAAKKVGLPVIGFRGVFTSDIPIGAGLSSSAAVEVAFAAGWQAMCAWSIDPVQLARLCQLAENQYVGVNCGLMDQFASVNGVAGHALYFDTRSLAWRAVPLPPHTALVIADSTVRRSLADSSYNDRRAACEEAARLLGEKLPGVKALRDVPPETFREHASLLREPVRTYAQHVVEEIARVERAARCLEQGDAVCFGQLMLEGHASLRDLYQVSIPELDTLVEIAANLPGCYGARLTGAGFGGCTVNLVDEDEVDDFMESLAVDYQEATGHQAEIYLCRASQGARVERLK